MVKQPEGEEQNYYQDFVRSKLNQRYPSSSEEKTSRNNSVIKNTGQNKIDEDDQNWYDEIEQKVILEEAPELLFKDRMGMIDKNIFKFVLDKHQGPYMRNLMNKLSINKSQMSPFIKANLSMQTLQNDNSAYKESPSATLTKGTRRLNPLETSQ